MDAIWKQTQMQNLLYSFFILVKVRVGFFDLDGTEIMAYPSTRTGFCSLIRSSRQGDNACRRCDKAAFRTAKTYHQPYIYQCHAGLTEVIAPIITPEEKSIGYLMIGQIRQPGQGQRQWKETVQKVGSPCPDIEALKSAYFDLTVIGMKEIRACANILETLAKYVWLDNYIRVQQEPLSSRIKNYISANLNQNLSLLGIAGQFGIGKTSLCNTIKRNYGQTMNELIRAARIERAKEMLQSGKHPVAEIAEQVGIFDYNYFTKVFKAETGVSPSVYRKLCEGDYLYNRTGGKGT